MTPRVLVLDAGERSALEFIRSLGKKGIEVTAADSSKLTTGQLSKYTKKRLIYPSPEKSWSKFIKFITKFLTKNVYDLLIPITEFTTTIISYHKKELENYTIVATPDYSMYLKTDDKVETLKIAQKYKIPYPKTFFIKDVAEINEICNNIIYPAVIKPRRKTYWHNDEAKVSKVTGKNYARTPKDLMIKYEKLLLDQKELQDLERLPFIQEYVQGTTYGVEALLKDGQPKAFFMHKRLAEYPITGGASTLRESTYHPQIMKTGLYTLQTFNWHGLAMVELKLDPRDETPKLIEINGRPWGSLPLAITAGVDFPYLLYKMLTEGNIQVQKTYLTGIKQKWLIPGHLLWLYATLTTSKQNKLRVLKEFIKSIAYPDDIMNRKDPRPTIGALKVVIQLTIDVLKGKRKMTGEAY